MTREFTGRAYNTFRVLSVATAQDLLTHMRGGRNPKDTHRWHNCQCTECRKTVVIRSDHVTTQLCRCQRAKKG